MGIVGEAYGNRVPLLWVPDMYCIYIFGGNTTIYRNQFVVSTHLKNISQIGSFPQIGGEH